MSRPKFVMDFERELIELEAKLEELQRIDVSNHPELAQEVEELSAQIELLHAMLDEGSPRSVTLGGRWRLRLARNRLWPEPPVDPAGRIGSLSPGASTPLGIPGWTAALGDAATGHPAARWRWRPASESSTVTFRPVSVDDRLPGPRGTSVRARRRLAETLPRHLRSAWPVFCEDDMIRWIPGVWQDSKPGDPSNRIVEVIRQ